MYKNLFYKNYCFIYIIIIFNIKKLNYFYLIYKNLAKTIWLIFRKFLFGIQFDGMKREELIAFIFLYYIYIFNNFFNI